MKYMTVKYTFPAKNDITEADVDCNIGVELAKFAKTLHTLVDRDGLMEVGGEVSCDIVDQSEESEAWRTIEAKCWVYNSDGPGRQCQYCHVAPGYRHKSWCPVTMSRIKLGYEQ